MRREIKRYVESHHDPVQPRHQHPPLTRATNKQAHDRLPYNLSPSPRSCEPASRTFHNTALAKASRLRSRRIKAQPCHCPAVDGRATLPPACTYPPPRSSPHIATPSTPSHAPQRAVRCCGGGYPGGFRRSDIQQTRESRRCGACRTALSKSRLCFLCVTRCGEVIRLHAGQRQGSAILCLCFLC